MKLTQPENPNPIIAPITVVLGALSVSSTLFVADAAYQILSVRSAWGVASASGTLDVEKLTGTTVPGSGTSILTGTINIAGTANTVASGALTATAADLLLAAGDRLSYKLGGVLTNLVGCSLSIVLKRL